MSSVSSIYSDLLNEVFDHFTHINHKLAVDGLSDTLHRLKQMGVNFQIDSRKVTFAEIDKNFQKGVFQAVLGYIQGFEKSYDVDQVWRMLRPSIVMVLQKNRMDIRTQDVEIPIGRFKLSYSMFRYIFGFENREFHQWKWYDSAVTVTNHRLIFPSDGLPEEIPLQAIATIGRELYIVYTKVSHRGVIKAIDYQTHESGLSCILVQCSDAYMKDFLNTLRVLREEHRKLSDFERDVLMALYEEVAVNKLPRHCNMRMDDAALAFKRLLGLRYIDGRGRLTSYGLSSAEEFKPEKIY